MKLAYGVINDLYCALLKYHTQYILRNGTVYIYSSSFKSAGSISFWDGIINNYIVNKGTKQ